MFLFLGLSLFGLLLSMFHSLARFIFNSGENIPSESIVERRKTKIYNEKERERERRRRKRRRKREKETCFMSAGHVTPSSIRSPKTSPNILSCNARSWRHIGRGKWSREPGKNAYPRFLARTIIDLSTWRQRIQWTKLRISHAIFRFDVSAQLTWYTFLC